MAEEKIRPLNIRPVGITATSEDETFALAARPILSTGRPVSAYEKAVAEKTANDQTEQKGMLIKGAHASHLTNQIAHFTQERMDDRNVSDREIRQRRRNKEDQEHMEKASHLLRELTFSAQLAIANATVDSLIEIARRPLTPDKEDMATRETVVVEQEPGIIGRLLGGKRKTTVHR